MPRTVLVTEGDSPLGEALKRLLLGRGCSVVSTLDRGPAPGAGAESGTTAPGTSALESTAPGRTIEVPWNRRSPVSAHTVLLTALNAFPTLDDVLILEPPCAVEKALAQVESAAIDKAFDNARGPLFLAREVLGHFRESTGGLLCLVSRGPATGPVENGMRECFRGFASALLSDAGRAGSALPAVNGFQQGEAGIEDYAAFIDRTLEEKARKITGRWFTCATRGGLFQGVRGQRHS